ncbi:hypothetical protein NL676_032367 [Syzygium grande]|nr:hypothetical protein NL676_032367 [Syzygium grande]
MEIKSSFPRKSAEAAHAFRNVCFTSTYSIEGAGEIFVLMRFTANFVNKHGVPAKEDYLPTEEDIQPSVYPYRTLYFHVYVPDINSEEWVGLDSIGDWAVFVDGSHSRSVLAREFPELEANSVYFTDDNWDPEERHVLYDMGVYSLQRRKVREICELSSDKIKPPPLWVFPSDYRCY